MSEVNQSYRASIAWIIMDKDFNFLFLQLIWAKQEEWDFVKGGMLIWENENQTLTREIQEELWKDFKYEIIWKSEWNIIYEWPEEYKKNKWFRWQARISYWIKYLWGSIRLQENELQAYKWVNIKNLKKFMLKSYYSLFQYEIFKKDYLRIKNKFNNIK